MIDIEATFKKFNGDVEDGCVEDEYLKFDRVESKRSQRPDLHAFLLLDSLIPGNGDIVSAAEHDEIFLRIKPDELANVATEEHIRELIRCGVLYSDEYESFYMFV